jgi:hypothetical protein
VVAATLVIASLSAGLYVANRQRAIAQRRFQDVRQLANKLFDIDAQVSQFPGSTRTRQLIVDASLEYLRRLTADARGDPELALEVGTAYMSVARVEGVPRTGPNLGQMAQAEGDLRIAEELIHSVLGSQPANRTALLRAAQIAADRTERNSRNRQRLALETSRGAQPDSILFTLHNKSSVGGASSWRHADPGFR